VFKMSFTFTDSGKVGENLAATKSCERATCLLTQVRCSTYPPLSLGRGRRRSQKRHHSRYRNRHDNAASNGEDIRFHHGGLLMFRGGVSHGAPGEFESKEL
jgi:hypothetical protein